VADYEAWWGENRARIVAGRVAESATGLTADALAASLAALGFEKVATCPGPRYAGKEEESGHGG